MPRKKVARTNKSETIRSYLKAHPKAKPTEIVQALNEQGVEVTPQFVSTVKTQAKSKKKSRKTSKATAQVRSKPQAQNDRTIEALLDVKRLAGRYGIENVKSAVAAYQTLTS